MYFYLPILACNACYHLAEQGDSLVSVDSSSKNSKVSKQTKMVGLFCNSSRKMFFQIKPHVSGYAYSNYAKTVSVDGAEDILFDSSFRKEIQQHVRNMQSVKDVTVNDCIQTQLQAY